MMKRIVVIGAGVSGLVSIKTCLEEGLEPVCFEKRDQAGGVWVFSEDRPNKDGPSCIYKGLVTNVSKEIMAFSDFPFPPEWTPFLQGDEVLQYYTDYARHFDLFRHIMFKTEVVRVEKAEDFTRTGRWRVSTRHDSGVEKTEFFDGVMVCTGMFSSGHVPEFPGLEGFKGQTFHSCQFRQGADFKDKRVLVVGSSHSAGDVAVMCSAHAKKVVLSLRDGAWIIPRLYQKQPIDVYINQRWKHWCPTWITAPIYKRIFESQLDLDGLGIRSSKHPLNSSVMISDDIPMMIMSGRIAVRSGIQSFDGSKVVFDDGMEMDEVDCVIFATGYKLKVPFLDSAILSEDLSRLDLYMHVFPPRLEHHTMAAIGYIVTTGGTGSVSELQARYALRVFKGESQLPSLPEMLHDIRVRREENFRRFAKYRPVIPPTRYRDELARAIGAVPTFWNLILTDPKLAFRFYFGPTYPACYRLVGPNATPGARDAFFQSADNLMHGITLGSVRRDAHSKLQSLGVRGLNSIKFTLAALLLLVLMLSLLHG